MRGLAEVSLPCAHRLGPLFQTVLNDRACSCAQPLALCVAGTWTRQPACKATQQAWAGLLCTPQKLLPTLLLLLLLHRNGGRLIAAHQAVPLTSRGGPQGPAPHSPGAWVWVGFFRRGALPSVCVCVFPCVCMFVCAHAPCLCVLLPESMPGCSRVRAQHPASLWRTGTAHASSREAQQCKGSRVHMHKRVQAHARTCTQA